MVGRFGVGVLITGSFQVVKAGASATLGWLGRDEPTPLVRTVERRSTRTFRMFGIPSRMCAWPPTCKGCPRVLLTVACGHVSGRWRGLLMTVGPDGSRGARPRPAGGFRETSARGRHPAAR